MDYAANEIEAAVAELGRAGEKGKALALLARMRYVQDPQSTVREQMREIGIAEGADRTYRNWVTRLHQQVMLILTVRSGTTRGYPVTQQQQMHLRVASLQRRKREASWR